MFSTNHNQWTTVLTAILISVLIEQIDVVGARREDTVGSKFSRDELINSDHGRSPAGTVETTVEPVFRTVRAVGIRVGVATNTTCQQVSKFDYKWMGKVLK